jgi:hypothetical protein
MSWEVLLCDKSNPKKGDLDKSVRRPVEALADRGKMVIEGVLDQFHRESGILCIGRNGMASRVESPVS